mmetsp:Transcript_35029/g.81287  ORF Transcript_35029/g.81287 Transcript_35029/m.81287 type:complete len:229 (-) Transcript_35029:727-1413(-)
MLSTKTPVSRFSTPRPTKIAKSTKAMPYHGLITMNGTEYSPQLRPLDIANASEYIVFQMLPKSTANCVSTTVSNCSAWRRCWLAACNRPTAKMYETVPSKTIAQHSDTRQERKAEAMRRNGVKKRKMRMTRSKRTVRTALTIRRRTRLSSKMFRISVTLVQTRNASKTFQAHPGPLKYQSCSAISRSSTSSAKATVKPTSVHLDQPSPLRPARAARISLSDCTPMTMA